MLEFNRPTGTPAGFGAAAAEPVRIAAGQTAEQTSERFSLVDGDELTSAASTDSSVATPTLLETQLLPADLTSGEPQPLPETLQQNSAEQWLQGMLGQRELQLEAREDESAQLTSVLGEVSPEPVALALSAPLAGVDDGLLAAGAGAGRAALAGKTEVGPEALPKAALPPGALLSTALAADAAQVLNKPVDALAKEQGVALASLLPSANPTAAVAATSLPVAAQLEQAPVALPTQTLASHTLNAAQQRLLLEGPQARWGEQMLTALRDSVDLQLRQQVQNATIRLDPPELGSMEIFLSHESGRLNVQISASNGEVARLLQQTSDRLRQELVASNFLQVNVQVGSDGQSRSQTQRPAQWLSDEPVAANQSAEQGASAATVGQVQTDVLVTV